MLVFILAFDFYHKTYGTQAPSAAGRIVARRFARTWAACAKA